MQRASIAASLFSNEINLKRAQIQLSSNIERMGIRHAVVTSASPQELAQKWLSILTKCLWMLPVRAKGCSEDFIGNSE